MVLWNVGKYVNSHVEMNSLKLPIFNGLVLACFAFQSPPTGLTYKNYTFCPHCVFLGFVWISKQTYIFSLCSTFYNRDGERLLRGTSWYFKRNSD